MSTPTPNERDLRLARRLDAGEAADGTDPIHDSLHTLQPESASPDPEVSDRLWARIEGEIGTAAPADRPATRPTSAPDRQPLRLVRPRAARWAVAAAVLFAVGVGVWMIGRPNAVIVATSEIVTWDAPDGSTVTLRPHSRLTRLDGDRAYRLEGEAFFDVVSDPDDPFTVEAGPAAVRVLGTQFVVSTWGERAAVFVEEGRVEVQKGPSKMMLGAGESAAAQAGGVARLSESVEAFLDWQRGETVFERAPVRRVVAEIGHHFDVAVAVPESVADELVSGVIPLETATQSLGDLGRILGGRFEPTSGGYRFVRP